MVRKRQGHLPIVASSLIHGDVRLPAVERMGNMDRAGSKRHIDVVSKWLRLNKLLLW